MQDQFDLLEDPVDIEKEMNTKFGRRLSNHTYSLQKQFMELKEAKGEEYVRNHPPNDVDPTKWIDLIDKKWNTKEFLVTFSSFILYQRRNNLIRKGRDSKKKLERRQSICCEIPYVFFSLYLLGM